MEMQLLYVYKGVYESVSKEGDPEEDVLNYSLSISNLTLLVFFFFLLSGQDVVFIGLDIKLFDQEWKRVWHADNRMLFLHIKSRIGRGRMQHYKVVVI